MRASDNRRGKPKVIAKGLRFPEGPAFAQDGYLWAVELKGEALIRFIDGKVERFWVGGEPNGIAIDGLGKIWFCDAKNNAIKVFDPLDHSIRIIVEAVEGQSLTQPNDLAFDNAGNLVFTCPGDSRKMPVGYVCVRGTNQVVKKITTGKLFPNGLAFAPCGNKLIIAETYSHRLWIGDWDQEKSIWSNERPWCDIEGPNGPGGPDGMAFHKNGNLYVAVYGTGTITIVNPQGKVIDKIKLKSKNPTNCAFDPYGSLGLVITEAEKGELLSISPC